MADGWLTEDGFERVYNDRWAGQTYDAGYPSSVVWHSIEGLGVGNIGAHSSPPHFWIDVKGRRKYQTVVLGRGSYAMGTDTPSPNRKTHCVQIEMTGFATQINTWLTEDDYKWLGEEVLRPIAKWLAAQGAPLQSTAPDVSKEQIAGSSYADAPQRFSKPYWLSWNGVCGHRHVWDQDQRYDPGLMDLAKVVRYANADGSVVPEIPVPEEEDDDMLRWLQDETGTQYAVEGLRAWPISSQYTIEVARKAGTLMTKQQMIDRGFEWNIDRASIAAVYQIMPINERVPDVPF